MTKIDGRVVQEVCLHLNQFIIGHLYFFYKNN